MAVEVVDGHERQPPRPRERLRRREPDEQRADQPGALGDGDAIDVVERRVRLRERLADDGRHELEVAARCNLGHDPAVPRVEISLRRDNAGLDGPVLRDERSGRLVARRLDAENHGAPSGHLPVSDTGWADSHG